MTQRTTLYLIRHGESEYNSQGIIQGQINVPLSPKGQTQARLLGERLRKYRLDSLITSDLFRAQQTAQILQQMLAISVNPDQRWREVFWGNWEGKAWRDVFQYPEFSQYRTQWYTYCGHGGESWQEVGQRLRQSLLEIQQRYAGKKIGIVSHGGTIRMAIIEALQMPPRYYPFTSDNTSISELVHEENIWKLIRLNDAAHLEGSELEDHCLAGDANAHPAREQ